MFKSLFILFSIFIQPTLGNYFVHITDAHIDLEYKVGSSANCLIGDKLGTHCCREYSIPIKPYRSASKWGDYNCDSSPYLVNKTIQWISQMNPPPDFIVYTGDSPGHHDLTQSLKKNLDAMSYIAKLLYKFPKVYPNIGNHGTCPVDQLLPPPYNKYLTKFLDKIWLPWLGNDTTISNYGYYSKMISTQPPVKLISLNTLYYDQHNLLINHSNINYGDQWNWLLSEVESAEKQNQTVWLIGHVYPGNGEATKRYTEEMIALMNQYNKTIRYQLWGHSHNDFHFVYPNSTGIGWVTPSIMPDQHYPAFRVFEYDPITFTILDYIQYTANLTEADEKDELIFRPEYSAKSSYNLKDMEAHSWIKLYNDLYTNQSLFKNYYSHYKTEYNTQDCDLQCQRHFLDRLTV